MAREKKDGKVANFYLKTEIIEKLDQYTKETGVPKTVVVEKALEEYLNKKKHD